MAGRQPIKCEVIRDVESPLFRQALEIYRDSFPANERQPEDRVRQRVRDGFYRLVVHCDDKGAGLLALLHDLDGLPYSLLDYFAVRADLRGGGWGSALFESLVEETHQRDKRLLMEVEDPRFGDNPEERFRRMSFYLRHGSRILQGVPYKLPPFVAGEPPTDMRLLISGQANRDSISGKEMKEIVTSLYKEVYLREKGDELLESILRAIPEKVNLGTQT